MNNEIINQQQLEDSDDGMHGLDGIIRSDGYNPEIEDLLSSGAFCESRSRSGIYQIPSTYSPVQDVSDSYSTSYEESPGNIRQGTPHLGETVFDDSNLTSIDSTPRSASSPYSVNLTSPLRMPSMQSYGESESRVGAPGTVAIPGPSSRFFPRTATINPSTQNQVYNRFDIGESFTMRTICQTSTPYRQLTQISKSIPESGYSGRMTDHCLSIIHSAETTPTQYETPFISQSRFGYTDPTAKVFNVPPDLVPFKEVSPSEGTSPDVVTYGTPPAVTPTTTRRHGLFTPKGVFKKKHFNLRRLFEPESFDSPHLKRSPQYYSEDSGSPEQYDYPYEENIMNKTFQASPAISRTVASPQHVMNTTFDALPPCAMNRTFDKMQASVMDRTFDASSPHTMSRSHERSQSSSPSYSPYAVNRTFDRSPMSAMDRTFDRSPMPAMHRTFDRSPIHAMDRTFDRLPMPALDRTFDVSSPQSINRTFHTSSPHALNATFSASPSYTLNRTFNKSMASPIGRTFQQSRSPSSSQYDGNRTFERSPVPAINRTYDAFSPQPISRTFDASSPHALNTTFDASPSYTVNRTFSKSPSLPLRGTFRQSPSSNLNRTFAKNVTFDLDSTCNRSQPSAMSQSFGRAQYPNFNKTFDKSNSPALDRTYDTSRSSDGCYNDASSP